MLAKKIKILMNRGADDYPKAFESWTATKARFPLGWPSRDKEEYQVTGWNLCVASGGFRGQWRLTRDPFGPCPPSAPGSPAFPWIKVQRAIMQNEDFFGALLWFGFCEWICTPGHCVWPVCNPVQWKPLIQRNLFFRLLQLVCLV